MNNLARLAMKVCQHTSSITHWTSRQGLNWKMNNTTQHELSLETMETRTQTVRTNELQDEKHTEEERTIVIWICVSGFVVLSSSFLVSLSPYAMPASRAWMCHILWYFKLMAKQIKHSQQWGKVFDSIIITKNGAHTHTYRVVGWNATLLSWIVQHLIESPV